MANKKLTKEEKIESLNKRLADADTKIQKACLKIDSLTAHKAKLAAKLEKLSA